MQATAGSVLDTVPEGTNVMVAGPPLTGKRELLYELLDGSTADGTVFVSTRKRASVIEREYRQQSPEPALRVVDCVSNQFGAHSRTGHHRFVSDAGDLTGIGIRTSEFMRQLQSSCETVSLGMHTLSTTLMYSDLRRVYQFLHVLTGRVQHGSFRGGFVLDDVGDTRSYSVLRQPFDGLVEVRDGEHGREVRVRGLDIGPRTWTAL
jgi:KaiC/GvpD/RAD55 family RecA-like ATPase